MSTRGIVGWTLFAIMTLSGPACGPEEQHLGNPTKLIADFMSTMTVDEAKAVESARSVQWEVSERDRYTLASSGEEVIVTLATADGYVHLGFAGALTLVFYNGRLAWSSFSAVDFDSHVAALCEGLSLSPAELSEGRWLNGTRIWVWRLREESRYVGWRDEALEGFYNPSS